MKNPLSTITELFRLRGNSLYGGEDVSQLEHALQAANFAEREGAGPSMVAAALLHDVGHLLHDLPEDAPDAGIDDRHEELAARWLEHFFGPEVAEPVRLHVPAKRYLCAKDATYHGQLSPASVQSLELQGGPMTPAEVAEFEAGPFFANSIRLRRWDDAAKIVGITTPPLEHYLDHVRQSLRERDPECH